MQTVHYNTQYIMLCIEWPDKEMYALSMQLAPLAKNYIRMLMLELPIPIPRPN